MEIVTCEKLEPKNMIKFFRRIRYDLMNQNKTSKYFKYAIGEIVLVVIGILIALQINNWNENRKDSIKEQQYLSNLKKEIQSDIDFNTRNILKRYPKKIEVLNNGKDYYQGKYIPQDTIQFLNDLGYGNVFGNVIWSFHRTTYTQLTSASDFDIIENDALRESILKYYNLLNGIDESSEGKPTGYIDFTLSLAPWDPNNPDDISAFDAKLFISKVKTEEFYRLINREISLAHNSKDKALKVNERAEHLISLINRHLND
ncbi:MAG: hypothetical protein DA407_01180 [Bacteroidetes bacterium]|nr:MAG: hypothetical protein DA407_01180 [Bacteroidota bacterium]